MRKKALYIIFLFTLFIKNNNNFTTPLGNAIMKRDLQEVKKCVYQGAKINYKDMSALGGESPLCHAAKNGDLHIAAYLIINGALISKKAYQKAQHAFIKTFLQMVANFNKSHNQYTIALEQLHAGDNFFLSLLIGKDIRTILSKPPEKLSLKDLHLYRIYHVVQKNNQDMKNIIKELKVLGITIDELSFKNKTFPELLLILLQKITIIPKEKNAFANAGLAYKKIKNYIKNQSKAITMEPCEPTKNHKPLLPIENFIKKGGELEKLQAKYYL